MTADGSGKATPNPIEVEGQRVYFRSSEDLRCLDPESVDFFLTSPPYWNLKSYGHTDEIGHEPYDDYIARMNSVWQECYRLGKKDSVLTINVGNRRHKKRFYPIAFDIAESMEGWVLWDIIIWYIPNALPQPNHYMERLFDNKFEFILVFTKDGNTDYKFHKPRVPQKYADADPRSNKKNPLGRCLGNIIRIPAYRPPNVKDLGYHQAAYPEELVALLLESFTDEGDTVLDPFLGSGTTLKVARAMKRCGIGIELNSGTRDLIVQRIGERYEVPDWRDLDILHSATMLPGMAKPRKVHMLRGTSAAGGSLQAPLIAD